jgi:hypothetical protein
MEQNLPAYLLFTGYVKAYNNLNRDTVWKILTDTATPEAIKRSYKNTVICIKYTNKHILEQITTNHGVRQGCRLSPILFNM